MNIFHELINRTANEVGIEHSDFRDVHKIVIDKRGIHIKSICRSKPVEIYGKMYYIVGRICKAFNSNTRPPRKQKIDQYLFRETNSWERYWDYRYHNNTYENIEYNMYNKTIRYDGQCTKITIKMHDDAWELIDFSSDIDIGQYTDYLNSFLHACAYFHTDKLISVDMGKFIREYQDIIVDNIENIERSWSKLIINKCTALDSWYKQNWHYWYRNEIEDVYGYKHYPFVYENTARNFNKLNNIFAWKRYDDETSKKLFIDLVINENSKLLDELNNGVVRVKSAKNADNKSSLVNMLSKLNKNYFLDAANNVGKNICANPDCNNRIHNMNVLKDMGMGGLMDDNSGALCCSCHYKLRYIDK